MSFHSPHRHCLDGENKVNKSCHLKTFHYNQPFGNIFLEVSSERLVVGGAPTTRSASLIHRYITLLINYFRPWGFTLKHCLWFDLGEIKAEPHELVYGHGHYLLCILVHPSNFLKNFDNFPPYFWCNIWSFLFRLIVKISFNVEWWECDWKYPV